MSQIKKKEGTGIKRVNINVEVGLHNAFKAATAAQAGSTMKAPEDFQKMKPFAQ